MGFNDWKSKLDEKEQPFVDFSELVVLLSAISAAAVCEYKLIPSEKKSTFMEGWPV